MRIGCIVKAMEKVERNELRQREICGLIDSIKAKTSADFTAKAVDRLDYAKNGYGIGGYANKLRKLDKLIEQGTDKELALDITESCISVDRFY